MVRKGLPAQVSARIKQALQALDPQVPADKELLQKLYGVQGFVEAKLSDFTGVARIAARYGFIKKPELFAAQPSP